MKVLGKGPLKVWCNNKSAISITSNPVQHDRTKYVEIDPLFIKGKFYDGIIQLNHVISGNQVADGLTKGFGVKEHNLACNKRWERYLSITNLDWECWAEHNRVIMKH